MSRHLAIVLKGYPRLSETFIAQEIQALEERGLTATIISLRHPTDRDVHPVHRAVRAPVRYLPEYLHDEPRRVLKGWRRARRLPGYRRARAVWLEDLRRDPTRNRIRRFGQALVLAAELQPTVQGLHAHFLHTPASVARYAAMLTGLPWSCSAHAKDIWTTPEWEKREKLADCAFLVTCTRANADHLGALSTRPETIGLVYHGLDFDRFPAPDDGSSDTDGSDPNRPVRLLSVGRAVPKKGYGDLLDALAALPPTVAWRLDHFGGGPLLDELRRRAQRLGLAERITWHGPANQQRLLDAYRCADLFVLASCIAADGDRDGLPNVLMEAQSQKLVCVATNVSGVPELVHDGVTGVLVPPADSRALARALAELIRDPGRRAALGRAGFRRVRAGFSMADGIDALADRLGLAPPT